MRKKVIWQLSNDFFLPIIKLNWHINIHNIDNISLIHTTYIIVYQLYK